MRTHHLLYFPVKHKNGEMQAVLLLNPGYRRENSQIGVTLIAERRCIQKLYDDEIEML